MIEVERELRDLLEHKAQEVTVAPERHRRALRRASIRRIGVASGTVLVAAALALGAVVGMRSLTVSEQSSDGDITKRPPTSGDFDFSFEGTAGSGPVVAHGTFRDLAWRLKVEPFQFRNQPERVAMDFTVDGPTSGTGSGDFVHPDQPFGASRGPLDGEGADYVFGWAPADAGDVRLLFADGRSIAPPLFSGPRKTAPDLSFFVSFIPADAEVEVISGTLGHGLKVPDVGQEADTEPTGEETVIVSGEANGEGWSFVTFDSEAGPCVEFRTDDSASGWCYSTRDLTGTDLKLDAVFDEQAESTLIVALVSDRVAAVEVLLEERGSIGMGQVDLVPADFQGGPDGSFAVELLDGRHAGEVRALDEAGAVIVSERFSAPSGLEELPHSIPKRLPRRDPGGIKTQP